ncbi:hypothetical protein QR685DRAFT_451956, partial [Neurospora intermedia]
LEIYNDFEPGFVTPYKKSILDIINQAIKRYLYIQSYIFLNEGIIVLPTLNYSIIIG